MVENGQGRNKPKFLTHESDTANEIWSEVKYIAFKINYNLPTAAAIGNGYCCIIIARIQIYIYRHCNIFSLQICLYN